MLGQLIGLFELNNLALNVPSPVTRYFEALEDAEAPLRQDERESAAAECFGLREALGEEAGQGVEVSSIRVYWSWCWGAWQLRCQLIQLSSWY